MELRASEILLYKRCISQHSRIPHILASKNARDASLQVGTRRFIASKTTLPNIPPPRRRQYRYQTVDEDVAPPTTSHVPTTRDKRALFVASLFGFGFALYLGFLGVGAHGAWQRSQALGIEPDADVSSRWDTVGRDYDDEIEVAEKAMFMGRKRKRLISKAKGDVLEVSVGTGRNMGYYIVEARDQQDGSKDTINHVTSLVFNDKAEVMVEAAKKKFEKMEARQIPEQKFKGHVAFVEGDAGVEGVIERPDGGFDTIVQTMGLCSTTNPVEFLRTLGVLCKKSSRTVVKTPSTLAAAKYGKEEDDDSYTGGRILLLEHGRGYYKWLNHMLDGLAAGHADHYGCWWNRDIGAIVKESGLEVESIKRYHLGTTWEMVLRPRQEEEKEVADSQGDIKAKQSGSSARSSTVSRWLVK